MFNKIVLPFWFMLILCIGLLGYVQFIEPTTVSSLIVADFSVVAITVNVYGIDKFRTKKVR